MEKRREESDKNSVGITEIKGTARCVDSVVYAENNLKAKARIIKKKG